MRWFYHIGIAITFGGGFCIECREPYLPPEIKNAKNYLVVDGTLHIGPDSTYLTLSRTRSLQDSMPNTPELNAQVSVLGTNGEHYDFTSLGNGRYAANNIALAPGSRCQLLINTADGKRFLADSILVLNSPPIESVSWRQDTTSTDSKKGVTIYVTTHDPNNNTWYYRWEYEETYEYHAKYDAFYIYSNGFVFPRQPDEHTFICWKKRPSTELLLATSSSLKEDLIFENPLVFIPQGTQPLSVLYSLLVKQTALTKEAYDYLQGLRKNTELTGSIFDPQPSQNTGNIRCLDDPNEPVLGYVYASSVSQQRIFISYGVIEHWGYEIKGCFLITEGNYLGESGLVPVSQTITGYTWTFPQCADCTLDGGNLLKPDYWP